MERPPPDGDGRHVYPLLSSGGKGVERLLALFGDFFSESLCLVHRVGEHGFHIVHVGKFASAFIVGIRLVQRFRQVAFFFVGESDWFSHASFSLC